LRLIAQGFGREPEGKSTPLVAPLAVSRGSICARTLDYAKKLGTFVMKMKGLAGHPGITL
jgi:hypothetical protein